MASSSHHAPTANGTGNGGKPSSIDGGASGAGPWSGKSRSANPVGGASAFGWLNSSQQKRDGMGSE